MRTPRFALCLLALTWSAAAWAGDADDTVHLTNGGRVRGTVMEEVPGKGVTIKLADGSTRTIPSADVKSVAYGAGAAAPQAAAPQAAAPAAGSVAAVDAMPTRWGLAAAVGKRGGSHYGGTYVEVSLAHRLPFSPTLALRTDLFVASSSFEYSSLTNFSSSGPSGAKNKGTLTLLGLRPTLEWTATEWLYVRGGGEVARAATSSETDPCGKLDESTFAYAGSVGAGVRFGKDHRAELGPRIDYGYMKLTKCSRTYLGYDTTTKTTKTSPTTKADDEASTIVTLQLTYLF